MKDWLSYGGVIIGRNEPGFATLFFDYHLLDWTFGVRGEQDPCWFSLRVQFGPVALELCYWREWPELID